MLDDQVLSWLNRKPHVAFDSIGLWDDIINGRMFLLNSLA
jgi:hypothetical protein